MNALREREINNNLERKLSEEQKLRGEFDLRLFSYPKIFKFAFASSVTTH